MIYPPVSIVITCYNLELYIHQCLSSVFSQDYLGAMQVIVVDDASTDLSLNIIDSFDSVDIIALDVNSGVLNATLAGIKASTNDIVLFLDGDDIWYPAKVSKVVNAYLLDSTLSFVSHDIEPVDSTGAPLNHYNRFIFKTLSSSQLKENILTHLGNVWLGSAYSIKKSHGDIHNLIAYLESLPNTRMTYQDWPIAYWYASLPSTQFKSIDSKLLKYRIHSSSYSGNSSSQQMILRNLAKSYLTIKACLGICLKKDIDGFPLTSSIAKLCYIKYQVLLYSGYMVKFTLLLSAWSYSINNGPRALFREIIRFSLITLGGPRRFIYIAQKVR